MNIVAIVAHMDDAETHCGGILRKYINQGNNVSIIVTSNGNKGTFAHSSEQITKIRKEEQCKACKILGTNPPIFLDFEDNLMTESIELQLALIDSIRQVNPSVIFTHWLYDGSNDHRVTANVVIKAMISLCFPNMPVKTPPITNPPSLFFFDSDGGIDFNPEIYIDITEEMPIKKKAFLQHKSQMEYDDRYLSDVELLSKFRGYQSGYEYAEGLISHRVFGYMPNYKLLP